MPKSLVSVAVVVLVLAAVSAAITYLRAGVLASSEQIASKGLAAASRDTAIFYAFVAIVVGIIGFFVFRAMLHASPDVAPRNFLLLAIGIGVVLEIMGAIVFKMRGLAELTVLHILHIAAYGWLLPQIFPV
jgi:hypothetical protein